MKCKCGAELISDGINGMCWGCYIKEPATEKLHTDWMCPRCGCVWAPQNEGCDYCNAPQMIQEIFIDDRGTNHADKAKP